MEKLKKLSLDEMMEMLREELVEDKMPYYWSLPVHAPCFTWEVYADNLDKMCQHLVNKYSR